ncbi:MAG: hypothetical protein L3K15_00090 [Thermoplasmata archaeon]|nr:hypothetical protein [Thermoplasmata archaeon]
MIRSNRPRRARFLVVVPGVGAVLALLVGLAYCSASRPRADARPEVTAFGA